MKITLFGGAGEIGGNKILLEEGKSRIFLDFGQSFTLLDDYFVPESYLSPRERFGLKDYFEFGLVPQLDGLYSKEAVENTALKYTPAAFDAVFITHAHNDHVAHLPYLHKSIPIYMGETTKKILGSTAEMTKQECFDEENIVDTFRSGKVIEVGEFKVTPVHVDHSVPGAYGFLVEGKSGRVAYTGDIRKHGNRADMSEEFVEKASEFEPDALIIEGTRVGGDSRKNHTEKFVEEESAKVAQGAKGIVVGMRYPKDLDRFRTFYTIAKESGRKLVISTKTAHLLQTLKGDPVGLPDPFNDAHIEVYCRKMKMYKKFEKENMEKCASFEDVQKMQKECVFELDFYYLTELVDVKPQGGELIHSMSEPFEEDPISKIADGVLKNWCTHFKLQHHQFHASGHASEQEIFGIIEEIKPKKVVPVHTKKPEMFPKCAQLKKGESLEI